MKERQLNYCQAINEALHQSMAQDDKVFICGEGVTDPREIFDTTRGLQEKFGGERVFDMPLSENGNTGFLIGAALTGMKPVMTHQRLDFTFYSMDQLFNHAAKRSYTSGGLQSVNITIRGIIGKGWGQGTQHSQSFQAMFAHVPGIKVVTPASAYDVKGLLMASIQDPNPVIFVEHRRLYDLVDHVPLEPYMVPIGKAIKRSEGTDITIVAVSEMVPEAIRAESVLKLFGISSEVIDVRTIKPLDTETIKASVKKTGRLIIADIGWKMCGISAEIAAVAAEECFADLKAPVVRIALPDTPTPNSYVLEKSYYNDAEDILKAACQLMGKDSRPILENMKEKVENLEGNAPGFARPF